MDILFLSHCVPFPPDKGERIRSCHELRWLAERHRVHLACFARDDEERRAADSLSGVCASICVEPLNRLTALARGALGFAAGKSVSAGWYASSCLQRYVDSVAARGLDATFAYTVAVACFAPPGVPIVLDMVDVDSEKWFGYARTRTPGFLYGAEAGRFRTLERAAAQRAEAVILATESEAALLGSFAAESPVYALENGVDFDYFDPYASTHRSPVPGRYVVLSGSMDYFPNVEGACWFAQRVLPELRRRDPELRFVVAGRNPAREVRKLAGIPGVVVTGTVPDIRPYLAGSLAVVAPLRIARGIQNKVLEALAMDLPVLAAPAVCTTFGRDLPAGLVRCADPADWMQVYSPPRFHPGAIRVAAMRRFSWPVQMAKLAALVEQTQGLSANRARA